MYGWAMIQDLPINDFKWSEERDIDKLIKQGGLENVFEIISMKSLNTIKKDIKTIK